MALRLHPRWGVWVLVNFHWCELFFSSPPAVSSSGETRSPNVVTCSRQTRDIYISIKCSQKAPYLSVRFDPGAVVTSVHPACVVSDGCHVVGSWTRPLPDWRSDPKEKEPLRLVNGTDGRPIPAANKACVERVALLSDAPRGHWRGIYVGSFTCQLERREGRTEEEEVGWLRCEDAQRSYPPITSWWSSWLLFSTAVST